MSGVSKVSYDLKAVKSKERQYDHKIFHNEVFCVHRLKNSFSKFVLNHHDVLDIKYSMEEINEFIRSHFS